MTKTKKRKPGGGRKSLDPALKKRDVRIYEVGNVIESYGGDAKVREILTDLWNNYKKKHKKS